MQANQKKKHSTPTCNLFCVKAIDSGGSGLPCLVTGLLFANCSFGLWIAALLERPQLADSVEKVSHSFHGRKVRA